MTTLNKDEYMEREFNKPYISTSLQDMINNLKNKKRVIFTKFGDGEGQCMMLVNGENCDGDKYTYDLAVKLKEAFVLLCDMDDNVYIGKWHSEQEHYIKFYITLCYNYFINANKTLKSIPFVDYHYCYADNTFNHNHNMYDFVKTIQDISNYKIIVSNENNSNLNIIFRSDEFITIPNSAWFANGYYNSIYEKLDNIFQKHSDAILLIAGGLASKVLITELASKHKTASFIDIGSGFDILAQNKYTRSWNSTPDFNNSFQNQVQYFANLLPQDYCQRLQQIA